MFRGRINKVGFFMSIKNLQLAKHASRSSFYSSRGDTIVEVLISMTILGLVMGVAFTSSSRSTRVGTEATLRNQALYVAQNQLEVIKSAFESDSVKLESLKAAGMRTGGNGFCADDSTISAAGNITPPEGGSPNCATDYKVNITYSDITKVFTVNIDWDSAAGSDQTTSNMQLFYKLPGGFAMPPVNIVSFNVNPNTIDLGESVGLSWFAINTSSCTVTGDTGSGVGAGFTGGASGSRSVTPTSSGTLTYTLTCAGTAPATDSVNVVVRAPTPPAAPTINSFTCNPSPIFNIDDSCSLTVVSPDATSCTFTGTNGLNSTQSGRGTISLPGLSPGVGAYIFNASCVNGSSAATNAAPITVSPYYALNANITVQIHPTLFQSVPTGTGASPMGLNVYVNDITRVYKRFEWNLANANAGSYCSFDTPYNPNYRVFRLYQNSSPVKQVFDLNERCIHEPNLLIDLSSFAAPVTDIWLEFTGDTDMYGGYLPPFYHRDHNIVIHSLSLPGKNVVYTGNYAGSYYATEYPPGFLRPTVLQYRINELAMNWSWGGGGVPGDNFAHFTVSP